MPLYAFSTASPANCGKPASVENVNGQKLSIVSAYCPPNCPISSEEAGEALRAPSCVVQRRVRGRQESQVEGIQRIHQEQWYN
jgi:hypothetical protein